MIESYGDEPKESLVRDGATPLAVRSRLELEDALRAEAVDEKMRQFEKDYETLPPEMKALIPWSSPNSTNLEARMRYGIPFAHLLRTVLIGQEGDYKLVGISPYNRFKALPDDSFQYLLLELQYGDGRVFVTV